MTNYVYISNLFKAILSHSKAIQGRFYTSNRYGMQEINYDQLGEVISEIKAPKKYPLAMMAPPHSYIDFGGTHAGWEDFRIILFFVKQSLVENPDNKTRLSTHSILEDWHDMKRVGLNFLRVLIENQRRIGQSVYNVPTSQKPLCIPFSNVGADRIAGVKLDFTFRLFTGCELEDYENFPNDINVDLDGHAEHEL